MLMRMLPLAPKQILFQQYMISCPHFQLFFTSNINKNNNKTTFAKVIPAKARKDRINDEICDNDLC